MTLNIRFATSDFCKKRPRPGAISAQISGFGVGSNPTVRGKRRPTIRVASRAQQIGWREGHSYSMVFTVWFLLAWGPCEGNEHFVGVFRHSRGNCWGRQLRIGLGAGAPSL